ncbi:MAG: acyltransferase [Sphingomonadales bacterium]|nr:acyltransferase [Sphingomonadales bacterium]
MRGIAALGVMIYHARILIGVQIFPHGYLAVDLFFVLSGFVIAYAYDGPMAHGMRSLTFVKTRLIRFYPLYLLGLAIGMGREIALIAGRNHYAMDPLTLIATFLTSVLFVPWPTLHGDYNLFQLNVPAWSLFLELLVNIVYAVLYPKLSKSFLLASAFVAGLVVIGCTLAANTANLGARAPLLLGPDITGGIARTVCSFSIGLLMCRLKLKGPRMPALALLLLVALALAVPERTGMAYDLLFIFLISPSLVILGASVEPGLKLRPIFRQLGILSFPLYAIHRPVIAFAQAVANATHLPSVVLAAGTIAALIALSLVLDAKYDRPIRARLTKIFNPRVKSDPAAAAAP